MKTTASGHKNFVNRTLFIRDNIEILDNLNSECVDLIYLDPPFNSNRNYAAPDASRAEGAAFRDIWTLDDIDDAWLDVIRTENPALAKFLDAVDGFGDEADKSYLIFMARRLLEMRRVLKPTGSIYLHCDPTMSHSLKLTMDCIFGERQYRNEIVWSYNRFSRRGACYPSMHDIVLFYSKGDEYVFHKPVTAPRNAARYERGYHTVTDRGETRLLVYDEGKEAAQRQIARAKQMGRAVRYTQARAPALGSVWTDIPILNPQSKERLAANFPTQKPLELVERIISASSNAGDVVLDPFCGCATAMVAAERLGRQWVGIDIEVKASQLIRDRLQAEEVLWRQVKGGRELIERADIPARTDAKDNLVNPKKYRATLYGLQSGNCAGCGVHFLVQNLTIDHIVPKSRGGQDIKENLRLLCGNCNSIKGDRDDAYLRAELKRRGLGK